MQLVLMIVALVLFGLGAFSHWFESPRPYYAPLISAGLFFATLSYLWPQIGH